MVRVEGGSRHTQSALVAAGTRSKKLYFTCYADIFAAAAAM